MTIAELLREPPEEARQREAAIFARRLSNTRSPEIVLYGAGRLGRKVAAVLRKNGLEPFAFADNKGSLEGTRVDGVIVGSLRSLATTLGEKALFVVTTFLPEGGGLARRTNELLELGCRQVSNFIELGWYFDGVLPHFASDLPSRILAHSREISLLAGLLADEQSTQVLTQQLAWRLRSDFDSSTRPATHQYFPEELIRPNPHEVFVDGGAFDGDTIRSAPWNLAKVLAIEPDPINASKIRGTSRASVTLFETLLGRTTGVSRFNSSGTMAAARADNGSIEVPITSLDALIGEESPTFIKLDVEGDELSALEGGRRTLDRCKPVMAVCIYHKPEDLWEIPLYLKEALPNHRIYLRSHAYDGFELVVYAIPPERCVPA